MKQKIIKLDDDTHERIVAIAKANKSDFQKTVSALILAHVNQQRKYPNGDVGLRGISKHKSDGRYIATCCENGVTKQIKASKDLHLCVLARREWEKKNYQHNTDCQVFLAGYNHAKPAIIDKIQTLVNKV